MMSTIREYLSEISSVIERVPDDRVNAVLDILYRAYEEGRTVFIFGNGGGSSTSSHLACDLAKGLARPGKKRFRVLSLAENVPLITAWANDTDYTNTFGEQLRNLVEPDDVVLGLSGSGMSPNVVNALKLANEMGARTILFSGFDGGEAKHVALESIIVPCSNMQQIEDVHMILAHVLFTCLKRKIHEE